MKIFLWSLLLVSSAHATGNTDTYSNYKELAQKERKGIDYTIQVLDRSSAVAVFAIHGGGIDIGTHTIAEAFADDDWSLYVFKGLLPRGNWRLHITSNHFDEPSAFELASKSERCLSIHGHKGETPRVCVGGVDKKLRTKMFDALNAGKFPFSVEMLCEDMEGTGDTNIVNNCRAGGVQLELSGGLREELLSNHRLMEKMAATVRKVME